MNENILVSVKKAIGIAINDESFDPDIIMHINSAFTVLHQLGVGPEEGFFITDGHELWTDFLPQNQQLELTKTYVYLKVKLMFDPPASSVILESYQRQINEYEWRLTVAADKKKET